MASGSALPNNPFNFTLEKVITNASGQLELDSSFTPIDFTLEDNASRLFYLLPMGDYRLKETLPPLYQITALTNATAITPLTPGEVQFSIDAKLSNPNIAYGQMQVVRGCLRMLDSIQDSGITRDGLYKALFSTGNPFFSTVQKVVKTLGCKPGIALLS